MVPNDKKTLYKRMQEDGIVECLCCEAVGKVKKSEESGVSEKIIIWKRKGIGKPYAEMWRYGSVPSSCDKCWQEEREERLRTQSNSKRSETLS